MSLDRSWMYRRIVDRVVSVEYKDGVERFIQFALENPNADVDNEGCIQCPCRDCKNLKWISIWEVQRHLYKKGFVTGYMNWTCHGEDFSLYEPTNVGDTNAYVDMVVDAVRLKLNVHDKPAYTEEALNKTADKFY